MMRDFNPDFSGARDDSHLIELWLNGRPETTQSVYRYGAKLFLDHMAPEGLRDATVAHVVAFVKTLTGAIATQVKRITVVKSLLSFAHRTGYTVFNVGKAIKCPKVPDRLHERIMEEDNVADLIKAAGKGRDRVLVRFFYASGARISEVSELSFKDIRGCRVTLNGKGTRVRTVLIPKDLAADLVALREARDSDGSPVFKSAWGERMGPRSLRYIISRIADEAGHELSPHWFRHAHASHALDHGAPIHMVQRDLGHKNIATTSRYLHAKPDKGTSQYLRI